VRQFPNYFSLSFAAAYQSLVQIYCLQRRRVTTWLDWRHDGCERSEDADGAIKQAMCAFRANVTRLL
jgi:hypothetical protein